MISVEQALEKILSYIDVLGEEQKPILDCLGQVLAEDVYSSINIPPLDNSAMDGYAVQSRDTYGASQHPMPYNIKWMSQSPSINSHRLNAKF